MKKTITILTLLTFIISVASADVLSGKTLDEGKWSIFYENGSQQMFGNDQNKFQINSIDTFGLTYGINEKWTVGWEATHLGIINMPGIPDHNVAWGHEGGLPGSLLVEYSVIKSDDLNFKVKLKQLMTTRQLIIDKEFLQPGITAGVLDNEKGVVNIKDTYLMFVVSKPVNDKLNIAGSMDVCKLTYEANEGVADQLLNDTDKTFIRWAIGLDYAITSDFIGYLYAARAMDSNAIGTYDDDVSAAAMAAGFADNSVKADGYSVFQGGLKYLF